MKHLLLTTIAAVVLVGCTKPSEKLLLDAAEFEDLNTVKKQLVRGANIESKCTGCGGTPLLHAAKKGSTEILRLLIKRNANVNSKDKEGSTPLHSAAMNGHIETVKLLVDNGADLNAKGGLMGASCLHAAAFGGHNEIIIFFLSRDIDVNATDNHGLTPMDIAKLDGKTDTIKILKEHGGKTGDELKAEGK